jgi:Fur family ferric uptake transcriptional regulator
MPTRPNVHRDEELRRILTQHDIRVTEQRMLVLREMSRLKVPISHPELTARLASSSLDRVTIYRNLLSMTEAGILVRMQLGDQVWRYELPQAQAKEHRTHPHFVCTDCGDVACMPEGTVVLRGDAAKSRVLEIQLRGLCHDCDAK